MMIRSFISSGLVGRLGPPSWWLHRNSHCRFLHHMYPEEYSHNDGIGNDGGDDDSLDSDVADAGVGDDDGDDVFR